MLSLLMLCGVVICKVFSQSYLIEGGSIMKVNEFYERYNNLQEEQKKLEEKGMGNERQFILELCKEVIGYFKQNKTAEKRIIDTSVLHYNKSRSYDAGNNRNYWTESPCIRFPEQNIEIYYPKYDAYYSYGCGGGWRASAGNPFSNIMAIRLLDEDGEKVSKDLFIKKWEYSVSHSELRQLFNQSFGDSWVVT